jgi:sugar lactone lactonase YvrE
MSDRFRYLELDEKGSPLSALRPAPGRAAPIPSDPLPVGEAPANDPRGEQSAAGGERLSWRVVESIGGPGTGVGEFHSPGGIAVDRLGNLYVADSYNHRVQRITPAGEVVVIGERGDRTGCFLNPQGVAVDESLRLFVVEQGGRRVQGFSARGELLGIWGGPGELGVPTGIACGPGGTLFVADAGRGAILALVAAGLWSEAHPRRASITEVRHPRMMRPQGVCGDAEGVLYLADTSGSVLLRFGAVREPGSSAPGSASWSLTGIHDGTRWYRESDPRPQPVSRTGPTVHRLSEPQDLAVDEQGRLFVVERGGDRMSVYGADGTLLQQVDSAGAAGAISAPCGVAVALDGSVYLADTGNHRILRLELK